MLALSGIFKFSVKNITHFTRDFLTDILYQSYSGSYTGTACSKSFDRLGDVFLAHYTCNEGYFTLYGYKPDLAKQLRDGFFIGSAYGDIMS